MTTTSTSAELVQRVHRLAEVAARRKARGMQATEQTRPNAIQETQREDEPKFAGVDEETMFSLDEYGGRHCIVCGTSIDGYRAHASTCSDACRSRGWRIEQKAGA